MNIICTPFRTCLAVEHISALGPPVNQWQPLPYVQSWLAKGRHAATDLGKVKSVKPCPEESHIALWNCFGVLHLHICYFVPRPMYIFHLYRMYFLAFLCTVLCNLCCNLTRPIRCHFVDLCMLSEFSLDCRILSAQCSFHKISSCPVRRTIMW